MTATAITEDRRPRLCIATSRYPRAGETFVMRHVDELAGGNTVVVCGRRTGKAEQDKAVFSRVEAFLNPADMVTAPWHLWRNHRFYSAPFVPFGSGRRQLAAFLGREGVDAILAEFGSQAVLHWPLARELGIPIFSYFRGRDATKYLRSAQRLEGYRRMMPNLAGVFAVSRFLLDNLAANGLAHPNSHVVPSGVDTRLFRPGEKRRGQMLFVGRFVEKKAPLLTLDCFLEVADRHPQARLDFIGHGPQLAACKARATRSRHRERVVFHGWQSHAQVREHLARADLFVLHALTAKDGETEGLPSAIQEAMACGAAILSTRHAGIPELVQDRVTGRLVDEGNAAGFAAAMESMLSDPDATRRMGAQARATAEERVDYRALYRQVEAVIGAALEPEPEGCH